jgi:hypothetical protein
MEGGGAGRRALAVARVQVFEVSLNFAAAIFVQMGFAGSRLPTTPRIALPLQAWLPSTYRQMLSNTEPASTRPCLPRRV